MSFFSFNTLNILFHSLLAYMVYDEKPIILMFAPLLGGCLFSS